MPLIVKNMKRLNAEYIRRGKNIPNLVKRKKKGENHRIKKGEKKVALKHRLTVFSGVVEVQ